MTETDSRLTAIRLSGFKSAMSPVQLELADITVLAGANSTGKSTVIQPLLLLKQTIEKSFDPGPLAIDGPNVRFTNAEQMFSRSPPWQGQEAFEVTYRYGDGGVAFRYGHPSSGGIVLEAMTVLDGDKRTTWREHETLGEDSFKREETFQLVASLRTFDGIKPIVVVRREGARLLAELRVTNSAIRIEDPALTATSDARHLIHLPGMRGNPERTYAISSTGPNYPGHFNDYVASIVHDWGQRKDARLHQLDNDLKRIGLTWRVTTKALDDTRVEVRVGRLPSPVRGGARDTVNIADVGFGVSQTLPLLVALIAAQPGQLVFIEQPEIHLHPKAQVALAQPLIDAAKRGARLIVETHSSLLILALQAAVAEQVISPAQISMNWFTRDAEGQTIITRADIGADGSYGDWPVDFDDVELDLQDRYMTSADRQHASA